MGTIFDAPPWTGFLMATGLKTPIPRNACMTRWVVLPASARRDDAGDLATR